MAGVGNRFPSAARRVTIADVAALAGVSKGTVSKYLAGGEYYVAEGTRARIAAAVAELDFRPNALAQSLVHRRTQTIGVVVASVANPIYPELIAGIDEVLGLAGYTLIFGSTEGSPEKEAAVVRSMRQRQVDGIIMASVTMQDDEVRQLVAAGVDVVLASRHLKNDTLVDAVGIDDGEGARLATEHLIAHGHRRIAHIAGPQDIFPFELRRAAFQEVLQRAGLQAEGRTLVASGSDQASGAAVATSLLELPDRPTALFAANDRLALGAIEACAALGLRIPDDLAVVGFDNIWVSALSGVQLTTADGRAGDLGRAAARTLIQRIDHRWSKQEDLPRPRLERLPTQLVRRATCGC